MPEYKYQGLAIKWRLENENVEKTVENSKKLNIKIYNLCVLTNNLVKKNSYEVKLGIQRSCGS